MHWLLLSLRYVTRENEGDARTLPSIHRRTFEESTAVAAHRLVPKPAKLSFNSRNLAAQEGVSPAQTGKVRAMNGMPLRIRVRGSARAADLLAYLRSVGADARCEGDAITVRRRNPVIEGEPPMQDRMELEFVLREWATHQPGRAFEIEEAA
jgi:hypothetical protein